MENVEVKIFKEDERGKFYLMRHPQTVDFVKIHENVFETIKMLDGTRTIEEIENKLKNAGILIEVQEIVEFLAQEGFIKNLPKSSGKKDEGEWYSFQKKIVTISEKHMRMLGKALFFVKTLPFKIFFIAFCTLGLIFFFISIPWTLSNLEGIPRLEIPLYVFFLSIVVVYVLRILHELAHALAYYFYGGKSVEMGIEFHFLMPLAYTDTLDVYSMKERQRIIVFAAGPLVNLFFGEVFAFLFFLGVEPRILWAVNALFIHLDILINIVPIMRTDGYYILQTLSKFPNLLQHAMSNLREILRLVSRRISFRDYKNYLADYSIRERKVLLAYTAMFPLTIIAMIYFGVVLALSSGIIAIILMSPQILSGAVSDVKLYVIWISYLVTTIFLFYGILGALLRLIRKRVFN